jgi:NAD(P)-dependent dehydrogenase (short-subunit alcohol dehydrogenase family)
MSRGAAGTFVSQSVSKVAIVTGGARGIGRAVVDKLVSTGWRVAAFDVDDRGLVDVAHVLDRDGHAVDSYRVDITVEAEVERAVRAVHERHGRIDVLVNNAGVNAYFDPTAMTEADWDRVFAVDLKGAWLCVKHVLPVMKAQGAGSIVNIASIHATLTIAGMFPYAAAKAGLVGLTRSLALDCAPLGIRVNAVSPGWTRTHLVEEWFQTQPDPAAAEASILRVHPMRRMATPEEIANVVAFVASDEASAMTGAAVAVDCGLGIQFAT